MATAHGSDLAGPGAAEMARGGGSSGRRQPAEELWQVSLPPDSSAPARARNLVADACHAWQLPDLLFPARSIVSELVTNAVEHARTEIDVTVSLRGSALHLSVRDGCPTPPVVLEQAAPQAGRPLNDRGYGLRVVEADSTAWGVVPAVDGKLVWATVRARDSYSRSW